MKVILVLNVGHKSPLRARIVKWMANLLSFTSSLYGKSLLCVFSLHSTIASNWLLVIFWMRFSSTFYSSPFTREGRKTCKKYQTPKLQITIFLFSFNFEIFARLSGTALSSRDWKLIVRPKSDFKKISPLLRRNIQKTFLSCFLIAANYILKNHLSFDIEGYWFHESFSELHYWLQ